MTNPFPKCISKNCKVSDKCLRKLDGNIRSEADYDKIIMDDSGKCCWYIEIVNEVETVEDKDVGVND
jgi:hypothetical protein